MDAVQQFTQSIGVVTPQKFFIGGASKVNKLSNLLFKLNVFYCLNFSVDGQVSYFSLVLLYIKDLL